MLIDTEYASQHCCEVGMLKYDYPPFAAGGSEVQKGLHDLPTVREPMQESWSESINPKVFSSD